MCVISGMSFDLSFPMRAFKELKSYLTTSKKIFEFIMLPDEAHTKWEKRKEQMMHNLDHMIHLMAPDREKMSRAKGQRKKGVLALAVLPSPAAH